MIGNTFFDVNQPDDPTDGLAALRSAEESRESSFKGYVHALAHGRFVLRRVSQILDEQPRKQGLEPLQHQALLQTYGSNKDMTVGKIADRLGIAPAFGSRVVQQLEKQELVLRKPHPTDRRATIIYASEEGIELLRAIDRKIYRKIHHFQEELSDADIIEVQCLACFRGIRWSRR